MPAVTAALKVARHRRGHGCIRARKSRKAFSGAEAVGVSFKTGIPRMAARAEREEGYLLEPRRASDDRRRSAQRRGKGKEEEMMKKGAWARSGVHLFSFPLPQSEESPAGGPRAASFVTLNVPAASSYPAASGIL